MKSNYSTRVYISFIQKAKVQRKERTRLQAQQGFSSFPRRTPRARFQMPNIHDMSVT